MKEIEVEITGTTPLLMNKYDVQAEIDRKAGRATTKKYVPSEEAEKSAYWGSGKKKELIIPSMIIYASMLNASSFYKIQKRSAKAILAGSIKIEPMEISLGTDKYEVDVRPVVIQRQKVLKGRAMLKTWKASFKILYNELLITETNTLKNILEQAGLRIGIMDYRPIKSGPFGCFDVTKWVVKN